MTEAHPKPSSPHDAESLYSQAMRVAAYPVSAALGFWQASTNIDDAVYDLCMQKKGLDGVFQSHKGPRLEDKFKRAVDNIEKGIRNDGFPDIVRQHRAQYVPEIMQRKRDLGIHNIWDEWKMIHRSQRQNAIINGITIGAVSLGAMLAMSNIQAFHQVFSKDQTPQR